MVLTEQPGSRLQTPDAPLVEGLWVLLTSTSPTSFLCAVHGSCGWDVVFGTQSSSLVLLMADMTREEWPPRRRLAAAGRFLAVGSGGSPSGVDRRRVYHHRHSYWPRRTTRPRREWRRRAHTACVRGSAPPPPAPRLRHAAADRPWLTPLHPRNSRNPISPATTLAPPVNLEQPHNLLRPTKIVHSFVPKAVWARPNLQNWDCPTPPTPPACRNRDLVDHSQRRREQALGRTHVREPQSGALVADRNTASEITHASRRKRRPHRPPIHSHATPNPTPNFWPGRVRASRTSAWAASTGSCVSGGLGGVPLRARRRVACDGEKGGGDAPPTPLNACPRAGLSRAAVALLFFSRRTPASHQCISLSRPPLTRATIARLFPSRHRKVRHHATASPQPACVLLGRLVAPARLPSASAARRSTASRSLEL